jgi:hypothetical protein
MDTIFHIVDVLMLIGIAISGTYLLIYTIASMKSPGLRFPKANESTRMLVLIPEGSYFDSQQYPDHLYRVEHYTDLVEAVQQADASQFDMFVILGEVTHVSPNLLKYINDAYYGNARAIQLNHIVEGRLSLFEHIMSIHEGVHVTIMSLGHNRLNQPSSIRRTDIAVEVEWLKKNLFNEKSNIENRMLHQGVFTHYLPYAQVYSNHHRSVKHDPHTFKKIFTTLPTVLAEGNINYAEKLVRNVFPSYRTQVYIMLIWIAVCLAYQWQTSIKWWFIFAIYLILIAQAVPDYLVIQRHPKK